MDLDMDSGTELPAPPKKARAASECSDVGEDEYQWDNIPPPRSTDRRLSSRLPWGNEVMNSLNSAPVKTCLEEAVPRDPAAPLVVGTSH